LELPEETATALLRHLNSIALLEILIEYSESKETDLLFKRALIRLREFFERCRLNRNDVVHSRAEYMFEMTMHRPLSRKPKKKQNAFVADLATLRQVADDIKRLAQLIAFLGFALETRRRPDADSQAFNHFLKLNDLSLPERLQ
jgi:hypothetical protein